MGSNWLVVHSLGLDYSSTWPDLEGEALMHISQLNCKVVVKNRQVR